MTWLDDLPVTTYQVRYGNLGLRGHLGYENKRVVVDNQQLQHAISMHAPSTVTYSLGKKYKQFSATAAINEDTSEKAEVTARVLVDGKLAYSGLVKSDSPVFVQTNVENAELLTLQFTSDKMEYCHSVWANPILTAAEDAEVLIPDCLGRAAMPRLQQDEPAKYCIATVTCPKFLEWSLRFWRSVAIAGGLPDDVLKVTLLVDCEDDTVENKIKAEFPEMRFLKGKSVAAKNPGLKAAMYSLSRYIQADYFLAMDADMIVHAPLMPILESLRSAPRNSFAVSRDLGNAPTLQGAIRKSYKAHVDDFTQVFRVAEKYGNYAFVVNDGIFAASSYAMDLLDAQIRNWPDANRWTYANPKCKWRNQFVFNLALAVGFEVVPLATRYNVQLHKMTVLWYDDGPYFGDEKVAVMHYTAETKNNPKFRRDLPSEPARPAE